MKLLVSVSLVAPGLGGAPQAPNSNEGIVTRLQERVRVIRPLSSPLIEGSELVVGDGGLRINATVKAVIRQGADWIVDARFVASVGGPGGGEFEHTTLGIGATRAEADRAVADDWLSSVGFPLLGAFYGDDPVRAVGIYDLFPGLPGSPSTVPPAWMDGSEALHAAILDSISPTVAGLTGGRWATVSVFDVRRAGEAGTVDCMVGGVRSETCEAALLGVAWPSQPEPYMLKQVYELRRHPETTDE